MVSMRLQSLEIIVLIAQIKYHILNCYYAPILEDVFCVAANGDAIACWQAQCCPASYGCPAKSFQRRCALLHHAPCYHAQHVSKWPTLVDTDNLIQPTANSNLKKEQELQQNRNQLLEKNRNSRMCKLSLKSTQGFLSILPVESPAAMASLSGASCAPNGTTGGADGTLAPAGNGGTPTSSPASPLFQQLNLGQKLHIILQLLQYILSVSRPFDPCAAVACRHRSNWL